MKTRITLKAAIAKAGLNEAEAFAQWHANIERERAKAANEQRRFPSSWFYDMQTTEDYINRFDSLNHLRPVIMTFSPPITIGVSTMSLESALQENTAALQALLAHFVSAAPLGAGDKTVSDLQEPAVPASKTTSAPAAPADNLTYPDVQKITLELSKLRGREAAVACLKAFGVTKGPELKPEQYAAYVAKAKAALNGSPEQDAAYVAKAKAAMNESIEE